MKSDVAPDNSNRSVAAGRNVCEPNGEQVISGYNESDNKNLPQRKEQECHIRLEGGCGNL